MKLKPLANNMTELEVNNNLILFSYETPVACLLKDRGFFRTDKKHSVTTTRHINKWRERFNELKFADSVIHQTQPQQWFDNLSEMLSYTKKEPNS